MTRRFSSKELSFLRNKIPIAHVIEDLLSLPTRNNTGKLSFACPLCKGFDTSINYKHNLARCFECRQNFNPIELVMHQRHISFVDSVKWLKRHHCKPESKTHPSVTLKAVLRPISVISCPKYSRRWSIKWTQIQRWKRS